MADRKAIVAIINGAICIDPSDVEKVDIEKIKEEAKKACKQSLEVRIAPIQEWMPKSGTEAIMNEAMKKFSEAHEKKSTYYSGYIQPSKNAIRMAKKRKKYEKRFF